MLFFHWITQLYIQHTLSGMGSGTAPHALALSSCGEPTRGWVGLAPPTLHLSSRSKDFPRGGSDLKGVVPSIGGPTGGRGGVRYMKKEQHQQMMQ